MSWFKKQKTKTKQKKKKRMNFPLTQSLGTYMLHEPSPAFLACRQQTSLRLATHFKPDFKP